MVQETASPDIQAHEDTNESRDVSSASSADKRIKFFVTKALEKLDNRINSTIDTAMGDAAPQVGPAGRVFGAASDAARGVPGVGPAAAVANKVVGVAEKYMTKKVCKRVYQFFPNYRGDANKWRNIFVPVLTETFINLNVVFCVLLDDLIDGVEKAMDKLAKDIVNRIFNHLETVSKIVDFDAELMRRAILKGKSEKAMPGKHYGGGEIKIRQKTRTKKYKTGSLHSKCDVLFLQDGLVATNSDPVNKYLYRYSFNGEELPKETTSRSEYPPNDPQDQFDNLTRRKSEIIEHIMNKTSDQTLSVNFENDRAIILRTTTAQEANAQEIEQMKEEMEKIKEEAEKEKKKSCWVRLCCACCPCP